MLRSKLVVVVACLALPCLAAAQSKGDRGGWAYVFAGAGYSSNGGPGTFAAGGGAEALAGSGVGIGGELAYLSRPRSGLGLASADVSYHFGGRNPARKLVPFITGGGSAAFRAGVTAGGANIGGGVQFWAREGVAFRLEMRDFIFSSDSPHTVLFRFGITFR